MRTRCRFGSKRRLVATIEWLRLFPKDGPFAHTWQTLDIAPSIGELRCSAVWRGGRTLASQLGLPSATDVPSTRTIPDLIVGSDPSSRVKHAPDGY